MYVCMYVCVCALTDSSFHFISVYRYRYICLYICSLFI